MVFSSTMSILRAADVGGYAVPAFNVLDGLSINALVEAATTANSPVILQASVKTVKSIGVESLTHMAQTAAANTHVPVALHLDHCPEQETIRQVVKAGWSSVLFDASDRDYETAVRETSEVVELAHRHGVEVETEIENIVGVEDGVGSDVITHAYDVATIVEAAEVSGADMLAPQLGTAHGEYKGQPVLLPERVRELRAMTDKPVVLHGGTGLSDAEFRSFIDAGVTKINISTALKMTYMKSALVSLREAEKMNKWDPPSLFREIAASVEEMAIEFYTTFGSANRGIERKPA